MDAIKKTFKDRQEYTILSLRLLFMKSGVKLKFRLHVTVGGNAILRRRLQLFD